MDELLACPFCGTRAVLHSNEPALKGFYPECNSEEDGCGASLQWYDTKEEAIMRWNRRAPVAQLSDDDVLKAIYTAKPDDRELRCLTFERGPYEVTYPTVFAVKLAHAIAARVQPPAAVNPISPEHQHLAKFYAVNDYAAMVSIMENQIKRLQENRTGRDEKPFQKVREG